MDPRIKEMLDPEAEGPSSNSSNVTFADLEFFPEERWVFGSTEDRIVLPVFVTLLSICAVVSNLVVILAPLRDKYHMRTGPYLMLLNISVADLILIIFCVPTTVITHSIPEGDELSSSFLCRLVHYVLFVSVYVSIYTLVVTTVFRVCSELLHTSFISILSPCNAVLSCIVIWAAFIISHLNIMLQLDAPTVFQEHFICMYTSPSNKDIEEDPAIGAAKLKTLWVTFLTCAFLIPLLLIGSLSALILKMQKKNDILEEEKLKRSTLTRAGTSTQEEPRQQRELTVLVMSAMIIRTLCWLPVQMFVMVDVFELLPVSQNYRKAEMIAMIFAFGSACVSPMVYACACDDYRRAFSYALCCSKRNSRPNRNENTYLETD